MDRNKKINLVNNILTEDKHNSFVKVKSIYKYL